VSRRYLNKWILSLLLACFVSVAYSQPAAKAGRQQSKLSPNYRLGPGDLLSVRVVGLEEFTQGVRVSNSGKVNLRYVGVLRVAGTTVRDLEQRVARELQQKKLIKDPHVQILVTEYHAQPVYILGEVGRPGQYMMYGELELVDLIAMAGGTMRGAREYAYLYRRHTPAPDHDFLEKGTEEDTGADSKTEDVLLGPDETTGPKYDVIKIDLSKLRTGDGTVEPNLLLRGGDLLHVLKDETDYFYVVGDVVAPGGYEMPKGEPYLVSRALSMAGGPTRTAKMSKGMLVRFDEKGQRQEHPVDFAAIFRGKQPDFEVRPNDIIFVPGSNFKTVGYGLLGTIPRVAERASYSAARN